MVIINNKKAIELKEVSEQTIMESFHKLRDFTLPIEKVFSIFVLTEKEYQELLKIEIFFPPAPTNKQLSFLKQEIPEDGRFQKLFNPYIGNVEIIFIK